MRAINIKWDFNEDLPTEMELPDGMTDREEISDYISEVTGFCHNGFALEGEYPMAKLVGVSVTCEDGRAEAAVEFDNGEKITAVARYDNWLEDKSIFVPQGSEEEADERFLEEFWNDVPQMLVDEITKTLFFSKSFMTDETALKKALTAAVKNEGNAEQAIDKLSVVFSRDTAEQLYAAFEKSKLPDWDGNNAKINRVKKALYDILGSTAQTERAFDIIVSAEQGERDKVVLNAVEQLTLRVATGNYGTFTVDDDKHVGTYSFVPYGKCELVYNMVQNKLYGGQEANPFTFTGTQNMTLVGVASSGGEYLKIEGVADPFVPAVDETLNVKSFDAACNKFSRQIERQLQERLGEKQRITVEPHEFLNYLAGKTTEEEMLDRFEAAIILEDTDFSLWETDKVRFREYEDRGVVEGKILAVADLMTVHGMFSAFLVEREDRSGRHVYDACIDDLSPNRVLVPLADDAYGFANEMEAQYRAEKYFADIVKNSQKTLEQKKHQSVER